MKTYILAILSLGTALSTTACFAEAVDDEQTSEEKQDTAEAVVATRERENPVPCVELRFVTDDGIEVVIPPYCGPINNEYEPDPETTEGLTNPLVQPALNKSLTSY